MARIRPDSKRCVAGCWPHASPGDTELSAQRAGAERDRTFQTFSLPVPAATLISTQIYSNHGLPETSRRDGLIYNSQRPLRALSCFCLSLGQKPNTKKTDEWTNKQTGTRNAVQIPKLRSILLSLLKGLRFPSIRFLPCL